MSTGETAREQSPQKVSSTFLLKLALSCVCNSIFKPAACQSHCAVLPAHASGFGAQCRGRGAGSSLGHRQDAQRMGRGHCPPTPACAELHGGACMSVWHMRVTPRQCVRLPAICPGLRGQNSSRTDRRKHHHRCRHMQKGWGRQVERIV